MTLVNTDTGEIVETLDEHAARRLTDRIRLLAETMAETLDKMAALIDEARTGSAWLALGYRSWTDYVSSEFSGVLPRLNREPRQEFVRELAARGMSTRAIAPVVGVHHDTVATDIRSGVGIPTPSQDAPGGAPTSEDEGEAPVHSPVEPAPHPVKAAPRPPVVGIDGKTYSRPERQLSEVIDGDSSIADGKYLLAFLRHLSRFEMGTWDADRLAAMADETNHEVIDMALAQVAEWHRKFTAARPTGLRVIEGGSQ